MMRAPPSTITCSTPSAASRRSSACRSTQPFGSAGQSKIRRPSASMRATRASCSRLPLPAALVAAAIQTGRPGSDSSLASTGVRTRLSTMTGCGLGPSARRTRSSGSSASTVPTPIRMASCRARSACVNRSASGPLRRVALAARGGDAAVQALRVGERDEGSPPRRCGPAPGPGPGGACPWRATTERRRRRACCVRWIMPRGSSSTPGSRYLHMWQPRSGARHLVSQDHRVTRR